MNLLAGDLVARGGIRGLDFACLGQHLVDLAVRNQHSAGGVGEHVLAGHHAYALEDYWNICLKRRQAIPSPASRLTCAVGREVVARKLVEVAQAAIREHSA